MRIGTKLVAGFLVMALVLVAAVCTTLLVGFQYTDAVEKEGESNSDLQDINDLSLSFYEEYSLGLKYLPTDNQTDIESLFDQRQMMNADNSDKVNQLSNYYQEKGEDSDFYNELYTAIDNINLKMAEVDGVFNDIETKKDEGLLGDYLWVSNLSKMDENFNRIMYGGGPDDFEGLDYIITNLSENAVVVADYRDNTMKFFETWIFLKDLLSSEYILAVQALLSDDQIEIVTATEQKAGISQMRQGVIIGIGVALSPAASADTDEDLVPFMTGMQNVFSDINEFDRIFNENITSKNTGQLNDTISVVLNLTNTMNSITMGPSPYDMKGLDYILNAVREKGIECVLYAESNDQELRDLNKLIHNLSFEYALGIKYMVTNDAQEENEIFEEKMELCMSNHAQINDLIYRFQQRDWVTFNPGVDDVSVHANLAIKLEAIVLAMEDINGIMVNIKTLKNSPVMNYTQALQNLDELMTEIMSGEGPNDKEGFDYITTSLGSDVENAKEERKAAESIILVSYIVAIIVGVTIAVSMGFILSRSMTSRLSEITKGVEKVKKGELNFSITESMNDEITSLSKAFNQMIMSIRLLSGDLDDKTNSELKQQ
jgi:HAMP domain-containing protein